MQTESTVLGPSGEPAEGQRFAFGRNWQAFLETVDEERIHEAERSLAEMLGATGLQEKSFLDVGTGSGLFSLAALRLGARRVHSFDFDRASVACAEELRRRFLPQAAHWTIDHGDVLDRNYLASLGSWDIVYSWGVLHHTGSLWRAMTNVTESVGDGGSLFLAIYNDQGFRSRVWRRVKYRFNALPRELRTPYAVAVMLPRELLSASAHVVAGRPRDYVRTWTDYKQSRGMSRWHDLIDWVGGYPFEVAKPEEVFNFLRGRGFELEKLVTCGGRLGCNQYVFSPDLAPR
jgi:2-polyprenyl-3-methyl-5-hydroxy-6-metoxy-1,4-benzoquinol methylase